MSPENFSPKLSLPRLFGDTVQVKILEALLRNAIAEEKTNKVIWLNFSDIAQMADVARSSGKRILDHLIFEGFLEEKKYETHAQNPPRLVRLMVEHPAVGKLQEFYSKVRPFL